MRTYHDVGAQIPELYLPRQGIDLTRWAVVACDQYTSQPEYWQKVEQIVGDAPSTLHLVFPEIWLSLLDQDERIRSIQAKMQEYLASGWLEPHEGMMYIERTLGERVRRGLLLCLDLEQYDFHKGSTSLIRATEGTIIDRLPPRIKVRSGAPLELPHILTLIDDADRTVIEPLSQAKDRLVKRYDFELMMGGGRLAGYQVQDLYLETQVMRALEKLADPQAFAEKYGVGPQEAVLLFAMGDGNHSLATAKAVWDQIKGQVGMDHPARYALVEIVNVHDGGLQFEPIHRLLFGLKGDIYSDLRHYLNGNLSFSSCENRAEMIERANAAAGERQIVGVLRGNHCGVFEFTRPGSNLAVGTLQPFLDHYLKAGGAAKIDYLHGDDILSELAAKPGNLGFYLPRIPKSELFKTVILDGALPLKTFSLGEAHEKRYYFESRRIS